MKNRALLLMCLLNSCLYLKVSGFPSSRYSLHGNSTEDPTDCYFGAPQNADANVSVFTFADENRLYVDLAHPSNCSGTPLRWKVCYEQQGDVGTEGQVMILVFRKQPSEPQEPVSSGGSSGPGMLYDSSTDAPVLYRRIYNITLRVQVNDTTEETVRCETVNASELTSGQQQQDVMEQPQIQRGDVIAFFATAGFRIGLALSSGSSSSSSDDGADGDDVDRQGLYEYLAATPPPSESRRKPAGPGVGGGPRPGRPGGEEQEEEGEGEGGEGEGEGRRRLVEVPEEVGADELVLAYRDVVPLIQAAFSE